MGSWLAHNNGSIPNASNAEVPSPCNISPGDNSKKAIINQSNQKNRTFMATYIHNYIEVLRHNSSRFGLTQTFTNILCYT